MMTSMNVKKRKIVALLTVDSEAYYVKWIVTETLELVHVRVYEKGVNASYYEVRLRDGVDPYCSCYIPAIDRKLCEHIACACNSARPPRPLARYVFLEDTTWHKFYPKRFRR